RPIAAKCCGGSRRALPVRSPEGEALAPAAAADRPRSPGLPAQTQRAAAAQAPAVYPGAALLPLRRAGAVRGRACPARKRWWRQFATERPVYRAALRVVPSSRDGRPARRRGDLL